MTEFLGTDGGQIAYEVTGLTAAAEEVVAARPELVWDLAADVTRVGGWSPECIRAAWLGEPGLASARRCARRYRGLHCPGGHRPAVMGTCQMPRTPFRCSGSAGWS